MSSVPPESLSDAELAIIGDALTGRPSWFDLAQVIETAAAERESFGLKLVSMAFVYDFVPYSQADRRETAGGPFATMWESTEGTFPPRVSAVKPEVWTLWRCVLETVDDAIVCSRLADLFYVGEGRAAHAEGRRAAGCLVELALEREWDAIDRAECIARALEIYAELNDQSSLASSSQTAVALVDELLGQEHAGPPFIVLRALLSLKPGNRADELAALLGRVIVHYEGTRHEAAALGLAADSTADPDEKRQFRRRQLEARVAEARRAEGLAMVSLLSRTIQFARRYGLIKEADALLKELQDLPPSELGLQTFESSIELPIEEIRAEVDLLVGPGATDAITALRRVAVNVEPPGGSNADLDSEVARLNNEFPIAHIFPQTILGEESSAPHFVASDEENKLRAERGRLRRQNADYLGQVFLGRLFDAIPENHGRPSHEDLTSYFATELIGEQRAERIARAFELFWDTDYDASAHVLVPRLESILRDLARARGVTIVKHVDEGSYGGVVSLNTIMRKLRELDPDIAWLDYLEALLCDPLAINLRNVISHGLAPQVGGTSASLLLHAALWLARVRLTAADSPETEEIS
jgi:hypothetical protein